ncbi:Urea ABC transporter [Klebsiella michiganensis]|uniref:Urea ABC transporter n=1 Tax=Klebsiella michiganensis TaxID=1134687 RepID=A0A7H4LRY3_9ENTR|nr:Urea ABC transporter [Klebsiella michiganensis]
MLQVNQLHQYYGGSHILRGVDFTARQGEITCLLGRNGVGKTTLLKCLMGLIPARSGEVLWQEKNITHRKPHQRCSRGSPTCRRAGDFSAPDGGGESADGLSRFPARDARAVPEEIYQLFPVLKTMKQRRGAIFPAGSSSSWPLAARWPAVRSC